MKFWSILKLQNINMILYDYSRLKKFSIFWHASLICCLNQRCILSLSRRRCQTWMKGKVLILAGSSKRVTSMICAITFSPISGIMSIRLLFSTMSGATRKYGSFTMMSLVGDIPNPSFRLRVDKFYNYRMLYF